MARLPCALAPRLCRSRSCLLSFPVPVPLLSPPPPSCPSLFFPLPPLSLLISPLLFPLLNPPPPLLLPFFLPSVLTVG
eukprot:3472712-Rhodomonas_salina.1